MEDPKNILGYFLGINNVDDPVRLSHLPVRIATGGYKAAYPLTQARNVDIDNTYKLSSRLGRTKLISGVDAHSGWSEEEKGFFVDGDTLYQLQDDFSITTIRSGLTLGARMSYARFNDRVYYCNGYECGYVLNYENYTYKNPDLEFKKPLPAGKFINVFMGCIYTSVRNTLYISDPLCDYYDVRTGYRRFANDVTMIRSIDDGIYVADNQTWFLKGLSNEDFEKLDAYPYGVIPYTDMKAPAEWFGYETKGDIAIWTSWDGI